MGLALRITFDPDANAAFIYLVPDIGPGEVVHTHMCDVEIREGAIILDFDADDRLLGVEILGATSLLPESVLLQAERSGGKLE